MRLLLSAISLLLSIDCAYAQETIVAMRHAEKPPTSLGQLTCKGLNRALALPKVLIPRYGKPDRIYAPDPGTRVGQLGNLSYSYVRPLMTIEPTAIQLEMPVNALIGFKNVGQLRKELLSAENANSTIYLAWEHVYLNQFAKRLLKAYGKDPSVVPDWPNDEYDRIYIFRIRKVGKKKELTFEVEQQHLTDSLSDTCPGA
ncbi:MAG TPA: hypothetical protein VK638_20875 [Edaphobacter sp.]|jgi:hypothetical protein|nr:hypothetical protein [Edaphobacter sp.]